MILPDEESALNSNKDADVLHSPEPKPERKLPSKVARFFSKLKAFVKAPLHRRNKE